MFVWIFWNGQLHCPYWPLLTTLCCWCFLGFRTFLFVFSCSVACGPPACLNNTQEFPSGSCRRRHIVALLPCCRHCSYNRMRQKMCLLMSVSHSRGWTRFDKYKYSEHLGLSQYQYKWKFTIIFIIGTHRYFHYNWLDDAVDSVRWQHSGTKISLYTVVYIKYIVYTHIMYFHKFSSLVILVCWSVIHCFSFTLLHRHTLAVWWSQWTPTSPCPSTQQKRWRSIATGTSMSSVHTCEFRIFLIHWSLCRTVSHNEG